MDNNSEHAFGAPGLELRWTHANKQGIGTAYAPSTGVWYTLWNGHLTEIYYPTVDRPQVRDLLYLVTDGMTFLHSDQNISGNKTLTSLTERIGASPGYTVQLRDLKGRYANGFQWSNDPDESVAWMIRFFDAGLTAVGHK
jgi:glucoamylase